MGTGGEASFYVTPFNTDALIETVDAAEKCGLYYTVIGNATNLIFSDEGFDGAVISTKRLSAVAVDGRLLHAECGSSLPALSATALSRSLTGLEGLVSIPGSVGGALVSNAGAFGNEISDGLLYFSVYLPKTGVFEIRTPRTHPFSYRKSHATDGGAIILSATFSLTLSDKTEIAEKMRKNVEKRRLSQPIGVKSVGSFFKKPDYADPSRSAYPEYSGKSAGELIDLCGLKGKRIGDAAVSEKHAGFLVNLGKAKAEDILRLAAEVKAEVLQRTGVTLTEECVKLAPRKDSV